MVNVPWVVSAAYRTKWHVKPQMDAGHASIHPVPKIVTIDEDSGHVG
jgi:hypothetical protein